MTHAKSSSRYSKNLNDIDYESAAGKTLLTVRLGTPQEYDLWKQTAQADAESIAGVAADAFGCKTLKAVCARSATATAGVTPDDALGKLKIKIERLTVLVKAAL